MTYLPSGVGLPLPRPAADGLDAPFWQATAEHRLVVQQCRGCHELRWPPEWLCHHCHSFDYEWVDVAPRGRIFTWTRPWHAAHPGLEEAVPYIAVVVELDGLPGVRMVGNLLGDPRQPVAIGAEVVAEFEDHPDDGVTLVQWRVDGASPH